MTRFRVREWFSGYDVLDTVTDESAWMSDGVDVLFDEDGESIMCGTEEFRQLWENALNEYPDETLEAYFPEQYDLES